MRILIAFISMLLPGIAYAEINVVDDVGRTIVLEKPAQRIISLAPHATELLYVAGGDKQILAAVDFSDYPEQAQQLPRVGSYEKLDIEAILALQPDLVIAWQSGNPREQFQHLIQLGLNVFITEARRFEDVAENIRKFGVLLDTQAIANQQANDYLRELQQLRRDYQGRTAVRVFYQVWNEPLFTVNGEHLINKVIELCGGTNVFADLPVLAPRISVEAVIEKDPEVIIAGLNEQRHDWLGNWQKWTGMKAVKNGHVYGVNADLIVRHTPRIVQGARRMCEQIDKVRTHPSGDN
ncbi:MAG: cobalamin-binding protein [Gammaproteobacteria bacterium]|nr:MAG: cobalamin-binding protein [Gammaproteobacteria bacterium]